MKNGVNSATIRDKVPQAITKGSNAKYISKTVLNPLFIIVVTDGATSALFNALSKATLNKLQSFGIDSSFGGGLWNGEVCGCVTGALMALGLKYGHYSPGDSKSKEIISSKTKEFEAKFKEKNKSIICREILGYDIGKPEEFEKIITKGILQEKCPKLAISACEILSEML